MRQESRHSQFLAGCCRRLVIKRTGLSTFFAVVDAYLIDGTIVFDEASLKPFMCETCSRYTLGDRCIQTKYNSKVYTKDIFVTGIANSQILGCTIRNKGEGSTKHFTGFLANLFNKKTPEELSDPPGYCRDI